MPRLEEGHTDYAKCLQQVKIFFWSWKLNNQYYNSVSGYSSSTDQVSDQLGDILNTSPEGSVSFSKKNEDFANDPENESEAKYKLALLSKQSLCNPPTFAIIIQ